MNSSSPIRDIPTPAAAVTDPIARWLRTNSIVVPIYTWVSRRLVPFLFALFVAAPIGVMILPFFIPKFLRNRARRRKYQVRLLTDHKERIAGTYS